MANELEKYKREVMLATMEAILEQPFAERLIFTHTLWLSCIPWWRKYFISSFKKASKE